MIKTLKIGGHIVDISIQDIDNRGMCWIRKNKFVLDRDMDPAQQHAALIHEIFEKINHEYNLELKHMVLTVLGEVWYQILMDNPSFIEMFRDVFLENRFS